MSKTKIIDKHSEHLILTERKLLSKIKHPFIVNMHYSFQDKDNLYLIIDFLQGGDLRYHLCKEKQFTEDQTKFIIANIILGLEYIHFNRIIHRDIKPENIVMDSKGYVKITDFGIAKLLPNNIQSFSNDSSGTPGYMAPEALCNQNQSFVEDFFALGVICYEMITGNRPYQGKNRKEIKERIMSYQAKISDSQRYLLSDEGEDFINHLLKRKPGQRLGIKGVLEVKNHEWFNDIDWKKMYNKNIISPFIPKNGDNYDHKYCNAEEQINLSTIERYEDIVRNLDYYNNYVFDKYLYFDIEKQKAKQKNINKTISNKRKSKEDNTLFFNPHIIYEDFLKDNSIITNIISPALVSSRSLDKKYLKFRRLSEEIIEKEKHLAKPKSERKMKYNFSRICFSEEKKPHQRNRKQSNGNNNFYIESSHTKSMLNHNENYI